MTPVARLNGTSDLNWDRVITAWPSIQFLDYTKNYGRMHTFLEGNLARNYHLTFSRSEYNEAECRKVLAMGGTVAVVFKGKLPETYLGAPVINGDLDDLRFRDPPGCVVGLLAKGRAKHDVSGFAVNADYGANPLPGECPKCDGRLAARGFGATRRHICTSCGHSK
jgi:hypothetical protein